MRPRSLGASSFPPRSATTQTLDQDSYIESLAELAMVERLQLLEGDWSIKTGGGVFERRPWFPIVPELPAEPRYLRYGAWRRRCPMTPTLTP